MIVDLTMNLLNRTAVYDIGCEIADLLPTKSYRYWRAYLPFTLPLKNAPMASFLGKALGRLALSDLSASGGSDWKRPAEPMVFVDPLFSLRTPLRPDDIVVCHDIAPITNPEFFDPNTGGMYDRAYRQIQSGRPRLFFVSDFTRRAYLDRYPSAYPSAEVAPLFFKPRLAASQAVSEPPRRRPYFLMVGGLERRKNYIGALNAFEASQLADEGFDLVVVGPRGNLSTDFLSRISGSTSVTHLGYASEPQLAALYRGAVALFFPSLLEGFGVPAIEAPNLGTVPIVSRHGVLEEIVGPHGVLVDPLSVTDMARGLRTVAAMTADDRRALAARISCHQSQYSLANFRSKWRRILQSPPASDIA